MRPEVRKPCAQPLLEATTAILGVVCALLLVVAIAGAVMYYRSGAHRVDPAQRQALAAERLSASPLWWQPPNPTPFWAANSLRRRAALRQQQQALQLAIVQAGGAPGVAGGGGDGINPAVVAELRAAREREADPNAMIDGVRLADIQ